MKFAILLFVSLLFAQSAIAEDVAITPGVWMTGRTVAPFDSWVPMSFGVGNIGDEDAEILISNYFVENDDQSFGRRMWVPPKSIRKSRFVMRTPSADTPFSETEVKDLRSLLLVNRDGVEVAINDFGGSRFSSRPIRCSDFASRAVLISERHQGPGENLVRSMLDEENQALGVFRFDDCPQNLIGYDAIDYVIFDSTHLENNRLAIGTLRQWVLAGGKLWIMLDQLDPDLLGEFPISGGLTPVGSVELTSVKIQNTPRSPIASDDTPVNYEIPVKMINVVSTGFNILAEVDGWPAVLESPYGRGSIIVTTIGPEAFHSTPGIEEKRPIERSGPTTAGKSLSNHFFSIPESSENQEIQLAEITESQIGYEVPKRGTIISILGCFCLLLPGLAFVQLRRGDLLKFAWIAPVVALLATGGLVAIGNSSRTSIEPMEVTTQLVQFDQAGNAFVMGSRTTYRQDADTEEVVLRENGYEDFTPEHLGAAKRIMLNDDGSLQWENIEVTAGQQSSDFFATKRFAPTIATLSVTKTGLRGRLTGQENRSLSDGILTFPSGRRASVTISEDGTLESDSNDVLMAENFLSSQVLTDQQRRRIDVYSDFLGNRERIPDHLSLYAWSDPIARDLVDLENGKQLGDALFKIPVTLERPAPGTRYQASPALISYRALVHPRWGSSTVFRNLGKQWSASTSRDSYSVLQVSLPKELGPVDVQSIKMTMDLKIPNRKLEVFLIKPDKSETLVETYESPVGIDSKTFSDSSFFSSDPTNLLAVMLHVGPPLEEIEGQGENALGWSINDVSFSGDFVAK